MGPLGGISPTFCHFLTAALALAVGAADAAGTGTEALAGVATTDAVGSADAGAAASGSAEASTATDVAVVASASTLLVEASQASKQSVAAMIVSNDVFIFFSWSSLLLVTLRTVPFIYHILVNMYKFFLAVKNLNELH